VRIALVDDMVLVTTDEICAAIKDIFEDTRSIVEPAGALGVAGIKKYLKNNPEIKDGVFVGVLSGANMNFDRLRFVAERARVGEGKEVMLSIKIRERPGEFNRLHQIIHPRNITEFAYRYSDPEWAQIFMAFDVQNGKEESKLVFEELERNGMKTLDISDNEMAKTHARYLAGGRSTTVKDERLFRFSFPERPGALKKFLDYINSVWNISLWHYRNQGGDVGKVLVGIQVPEADNAKFDDFLKRLAYPYVDETQNRVYLDFFR